MNFIKPRFVQKYGSKLNRQNLEVLENKISNEYISTKYHEYLQMNNVIYLFSWDVNDGTKFLDKDQYWRSFSHSINKHNFNNNNNFSIVRSKIYTQILSRTLKNDMNTNWVCSNNNINNNHNNRYGNLNMNWQEDNDIRCIFQEISTSNGNTGNNNNKGELTDLIQSLTGISQILHLQKPENNLYSLNLSHLCLKMSGAHGINLHENLDSTSISLQNHNTHKAQDKILDYQGLLRLATLSREETDLQKFMKLLIKEYGINKPSLTYDSDTNEQWLILSH